MAKGVDSGLVGFRLKSCPPPRRRTLVKVGEDNEGGKVTQAYYQVVLNKAHLA